MKWFDYKLQRANWNLIAPGVASCETGRKGDKDNCKKIPSVTLVR